MATFSGGSGADNFTGGADADQASGNGGDDVLRGAGGNDTLDGGEGNDILDGGLGADSMAGGSGDDVYIVDDEGDSVTELAGEGTDEVRTALASFGLAGLVNVELLTGTSDAGQALTGNDLANTIRGGWGSDVIDGGLGADSMRGSLGNDIYIVDDAGDTVVEGDEHGLDEVRTNLSSFSLAPFANVENLTGGSADQTLTGNAWNNVIDGGAGADAMAGAGGHDIYIVDNAGDTVTEMDGAGIDEVRTSLGSKAAPAYALYVLPSHVENLTGTSAGDQGVRGNALSNVIIMGAGADLIVVDDGGVDTVNAGGGNDYIYYGQALTAADVTNGGAGIDTLGLRGNYSGGAASAITFTATGLVGVERLALYGGNGFNNYGIHMHDANVAAGTEFFVTAVSLLSTEGLFFIGSGETDGRFTVLGGAGTDTIAGGGLGDYIAGNAGDDLIYGVGGNDFLLGGLGADDFLGGEGYDAFRYDSVAESTAGSMDEILDFTELDRIDLSRIDANNNGGDGDTAFTFIGTNAFGNVAGQLRAVQSGDFWMVEGDVNGDGVADLVIQVTVAGSVPLAAEDFFL